MSSLGELLAAGQVARAAELANQRLARDARDTQALLALARVALVEGDEARAESLLQQAASLGAAREVTLVRAALALRREEWERAQTLYLPLAAAGAPQPEVWYGLGVALLGLDNVEAAREALERAVEGAPQVPSFRFELGRAWAKSGQVRPAVRQLVSCLRLNGADARAWRLLIELLAQRGKTLSLERLLRRGLEHAPEAELLRELLPVEEADPARVQQITGLMSRCRYREALRLVREAQEQGERSWTLKFLEAKACQSLQPPDVEGALRAYAEAMELEPTAWAACNDLGLLLMQQGRRHIARAIEVLHEAWRRAPTRPEPVFNLAVACSRGGRTDESIGLARLIVETLPPEHLFHGHAQALLRKLGAA